ncbi:hypothetical protein HYS54_00055, partial [Candidatus Micrarchaeota archaeon]|nr:hypothetical protein [Candidatus Micrarchaeota archaeon]
MKLALSALMLAVVAVSAGCISQLDKPLAGFSIKYSELPGTNDHDRTTTTITVSGNGSITSSRGGIIKEGKLSIEEMGQLVQKTLLSGLFSRVLDRGENCNKIPEAGSTLLEVNLAGETRSVESSCPTKEVGELITYLQALAERIVEKNAGEFDLSMVSDEGLERFYEFRISGNGSVELVTHDSRKWRSLSRQELGDLQGVIRENNFFDADLHDPLAGACVAVSVLLPSRSLTISMDGRTRNVEMNVCPLAPGFRNIESRLSRIEESLVGVTYVEQADGTAYWEITGNDSGFEESVLRVQTFNRGN